MADVFVSYKSQDRPRIALLVRALQERGLTVWWDQRLETGSVWLACIKRALDAATSVLAAWTPQSVGPDRVLVSHMMQSEVDEAVRSSPRRLVPARLASGPLPFGYDGFQAADLTSWSGEPEALAIDTLVATICEIVGPRSPFPPEELVAWRKAEAQNHPQAFRDFAAHFPNSRFTNDAERRAAELAQATADLELANTAASEIAKRFAVQAEAPDFAPPPALEKVDKGKPSPVDLYNLFETIAAGGRLLLEAEPGAGKTVTLLTWARTFCDDRALPVGLYVRLQDLAGNDDELLAHIAKTYATGAVRVDAWQALLRSGAAVVFCDGWNELSATRRESVGARLDNLVRLYPEAGLVVGSRPLSPAPFTGPHTVIQLQRLTLSDVRAIIEHRLGERAPAALAELRTAPELRELVRNPFFLQAFCVSRADGASPTTRYGLVEAMIAARERGSPHAQRLRSELANQQSKFMRALAVDLLIKQHELTTDEALRVVNGVSAQLLSAQLLSPSPSGQHVLDVLRDHHCLVEHAGQPVTYAIQHQLIEEWYAAEEILALAIAALSDEAAADRLTQSFLDESRWTEALLFAVESAAGNATAERACAFLILRMVGIGCQFAARLIAVAPPNVWRKIAPAIMSFAEAWKPTAGYELIRFAVACGKAEFAPLVWETIAAEKSGNVANALRDHRLPHPEVLGIDWRERVRALNPEGRRSILYMLASNSGIEAAKMAADAAIEDEDAEVQFSTAEMLHFYHYDEELECLLSNARAETWEKLSARHHIEDLLADPWRPHMIAAAHRVVAKLPAGPHRLHVALWLRQQGEDVALDVVADLLSAKFEFHGAEDESFRQVMALEGERLSTTIIERALAGERVPYLAEQYLRQDTPVDQARLLVTCRAKNAFGINTLLAPLLTVESLSTLFGELLDLSAQWNAGKGISDSYHAIQDALTSADRNRLAECVLGLGPSSPNAISVVCDVIARANRAESRQTARTALRRDLREQVIKRLIEWSVAIVADASSGRNTLHALAEAMAIFPDAALLDPLRSLLVEDVRRWTSEKEEFKATLAAGRQPDPGSGARMSYAFRYAQNMISLANTPDGDADDSEIKAPAVSDGMTAAVIDILCSFLTQPEFGPDASNAIAHLNPDPMLAIGNVRQHLSIDLRVVPERREARRKSGVGSVDAIATRVLDAIDKLAAEGGDQSSKLAVELALRASRMACGDRYASLSALVNARGGVEQKITFQTNLLLCGHSVSAEVAARCLDELDARRTERAWEYDQSWFRWEQPLILMIFGGEPVAAAERLLTYEQRGRDHDERRIIEALGLCGDPRALEALQTLRSRCDQHHIRDAWCSAVYGVGNATAGDALLMLLMNWQGRMDWHAERTLTSMIADLAVRHPGLRRQIIDIARTGNTAQLERIGGVVGEFADQDIIAEFLALPPDSVTRLENAIGGTLYNICYRHEPSEETQGTFDVVAMPAQRIRAQLFAGACAEGAAKNSYARLLRSIDTLREEYVQAFEEPRHPNIALGKPWPEAADIAWQAANDIRQTGEQGA